jgi:hypothetical protein
MSACKLVGLGHYGVKDLTNCLLFYFNERGLSTFATTTMSDDTIVVNAKSGEDCLEIYVEVYSIKIYYMAFSGNGPVACDEIDMREPGSLDELEKWVVKVI